MIYLRDFVAKASADEYIAVYSGYDGYCVFEGTPEELINGYELDSWLVVDFWTQDDEIKVHVEEI